MKVLGMLGCNEDPSLVGGCCLLTVSGWLHLWTSEQRERMCALGLNVYIDPSIIETGPHLMPALGLNSFHWGLPPKRDIMGFGAPKNWFGDICPPTHVHNIRSQWFTLLHWPAKSLSSRPAWCASGFVSSYSLFLSEGTMFCWWASQVYLALDGV